MNEGTEMKYINAAEILPERLLQEYIFPKQEQKLTGEQKAVLKVFIRNVTRE